MPPSATRGDELDQQLLRFARVPGKLSRGLALNELFQHVGFMNQHPFGSHLQQVHAADLNSVLLPSELLLRPQWAKLGDWQEMWELLRLPL